MMKVDDDDAAVCLTGESQQKGVGQVCCLSMETKLRFCVFQPFGKRRFGELGYNHPNRRKA